MSAVDDFETLADLVLSPVVYVPTPPDSADMGGSYLWWQAQARALAVKGQAAIDELKNENENLTYEVLEAGER